MIGEFALEPTMLNNWDRFQRFIGLFGIAQGRLISRYPKKWEAMVLESVAGNVEKVRITEALVRARSVLFPREHEWNPASLWIDNAIIEHGKRPFTAILASNEPSGNGDIVDATDLDVTNLPTKLRAGPSQFVVRTAADMAIATRVLLQFSKKIVLIDRNFAPDTSRFKGPLEEMLMWLLDRYNKPRPVEVEVHLGHRVLATALDFKAACIAHLQDVVPIGMRLTVVRWNHDDLHNRYILTDRGGILIGEGLDEANRKSARTDDVLSLLDPATAIELVERYCGTAALPKHQVRHTIAGRKVT